MFNLAFRRWSVFFGSVALLASIAAQGASRVEAGDSKPLKKDSRSSAQPKEATFTTSVSPARAKPGDVVTYKVTAKVDAPCHIYSYSKKQADDGPKSTTFDFFDSDGLTIIDGDWTPSREPIRKKEPAFPDLPHVEYYEEEVSWTIKLQVPPKATLGKKTLRCQIGYMLCSDQNCSFPGQWTLPDAEVTIATDAPKVAGNFAKARLVSLVADEAPKPAKKDSRIPQPAAVKFSTAIVPAEAKAGDKVTLQVTAKLEPDWHIFQYAKSWSGDGPMSTLFDSFDLAGLVPKGEWTSSEPPIRKKDPNFPDIEALELFEKEVTWNLPLEVPGGLEPGSKSVHVQAGFQVCSSKSCSRAGSQWTLPGAIFTLLPGGSAAPAVATPAPTASPTPTASATVSAPADSSVGKSQDLPVSDVALVTKSKSTPKVSSEIEKTSQAGIIPFLLACAGGGLLALVMPCVWPMIPVTVNFFVKQGQKDKGAATRLAFVYCLAIIGIFTGLGVLFSVFLGASSLSNLANNPWLNMGVALLFLGFGLSLLGLFEMRLPNFLLNASAQGESKGGLIGVMFMASTLTITSFTCTFPVVGGLLVLASNGSYFFPVVGLATFASVVAFPFFLLALAPGLLARMPKSGDWMNTVKMVGGLIEIAAAFKFVNTAELGFNAVPEAAWCDEQTLLTIWVVMSLICGIYLLGLFKTDHDQAETKVGPARIIFASLFLFFGIYLTPALFGQEPSGPIYNRLVVGLLPPRGSETKATSSDPMVAITQEKSKHGVIWGMSYEAALVEARRDKKRILIDFTGVNCSNCRLMERSVLPRPEVAAKMKEFVTVQLSTDFVPISSITQAQREELGDKNIEREIAMTGASTNPFYVIVDPSEGQEEVIARQNGACEAPAFLEFLEKGAVKR